MAQSDVLMIIRGAFILELFGCGREDFRGNSQATELVRREYRDGWKIAGLG